MGFTDNYTVFLYDTAGWWTDMTSEPFPGEGDDS